MLLDSMMYVEVDTRLHKAFRKQHKAYDLSIPIQKTYSKSKNKILVVMGNVNFRDLRKEAGGRLLGDDTSFKVFSNILEFAWRSANVIEKTERPSFAVVNFDLFRTNDLNSDAIDLANKHAARRIHKLIDELRPDKVLVFGDEAANYILEGTVLDLNCKRGSAHKHKTSTKGTKFKVFTTITYDSAFTPRKESDEDLDDDAVTMANIIGYCSRQVRNCIMGKNPYSLKGLKYKHAYIDSIEKFRKLAKKLMSCDVCSLDIETKNLSHKSNSVLTMQFAFEKDFAYFLPVLHKDSPFDADEIEEIRLTLKKFLERKDVRYHPRNKVKKYLLGQNFGFDLRVLSEWCKVPYIYWPVWDTIAGENCLDENLKALQKYGNTPYSLDTIFGYYENFHYYSANFKKSDRTRIEFLDLDADVIEYGCMDVISVFNIHLKQIEQASHLTFGVNAQHNYRDVYINFILAQMSNMVKVMSRMSSRGVLLDVPYLVELMGEDSKISALIKDQLNELLEMDSVKKCEKLLKSNKGVPTRSLFGKTDASCTLFDINKTESQNLLFFDVLKLEPTEYGKDGITPSLGKGFKDTYKKEVKEVAIFAQIEKLKKLKSAFIDTMYGHLSDNLDSHLDNRLRPGFGYKDVVTGRSNSFKPSLQQIPVHSAEAKYVKRMFISPKGKLNIDVDYSSHEVRCGGYISGDEGLLGGFRKIHDIIVEYRKYPSKENLEAVLTKGDSHKMNYSFFTGMAVEEWVILNRSDEGKVKAKALRQISKGIVFGCFYGKGPRSVARDINKPIEEAETLLKNFFKKFHVLEKWLTWTKKFSKENFYTFSPIGRRRNLYGYMAEINAMVASMERRAQNSPIQGFASDISFDAADLFSRVSYECFLELGEHEVLEEMPTGPNVMVHDSIKTEAYFRHVMLTMHLLEWSLTTGVQAYLKEMFNLELTCPLNVDFDVGSGWHAMEGWDFNPRELDNVFRSALEEHKRIHNWEDLDVEKTIKGMYDSYLQQSKKLKLNERFPLNFEQFEPELL